MPITLAPCRAIRRTGTWARTTFPSRAGRRSLRTATIGRAATGADETRLAKKPVPPARTGTRIPRTSFGARRAARLSRSSTWGAASHSPAESSPSDARAMPLLGSAAGADRGFSTNSTRCVRCRSPPLSTASVGGAQRSRTWTSGASNFSRRVAYPLAASWSSNQRWARSCPSVPTRRPAYSSLQSRSRAPWATSSLRAAAAATWAGLSPTFRLVPGLGAAAAATARRLGALGRGGFATTGRGLVLGTGAAAARLLLSRATAARSDHGSLDEAALGLGLLFRLDGHLVLLCNVLSLAAAATSVRKLRSARQAVR